MSAITTRDGTKPYYKDWGRGPAVTFSHGWPLSADAWDGQMLFLAQHGFRADVPTLVLHGEDDQIVPARDSAVRSARRAVPLPSWGGRAGALNHNRGTSS